MVNNNRQVNFKRSFPMAYRKTAAILDKKPDENEDTMLISGIRLLNSLLRRDTAEREVKSCAVDRG